MVSIRSALVAIVLSSIFDGVNSSCGHGTSLLKRVTKMKRQEGGAVQKVVEVGKFGYIGSQGPTQWASLSPEFTGCATNTIQSPIDLTNQTTTVLPPGSLTINFPDVATTEFENIGTTVEVVMEGKGAKTTVAGKEFELKQFHFHTPSEHTIDGEYFPLEMHMVHEAADKTIAVIAAHFQLSEGGETTELIKGVMDKIGEISAPGTVAEVGPLAFAPLVKALSEQNILEYTGSLTTPPCAEGLIFLVTSQQLPLDVATFNKVKAVVGFNSRFTQNAPKSPNLLSLSSAAVGSLVQAPGAVVAAPAESAAVSAVESAVAAPTGAAAAAPAEAVKVDEAAKLAEEAKLKAEEEAKAKAGESAKVEALPAGEAKASTPQPGKATVSTINANSGNVAEIVKGLTGLDLSSTLNLGKLA